MPNVAELITEHVTLTVDCVDRLYLNAHVPRLQSEGGVVAFLCHRGHRIASPALFGQITETFKTQLRAWADRQGIPWIEFQKGERKDDAVQRYRARFGQREGVVCVGVAQEKAKAWTATKDVQGRHLHFRYRWKPVCVNHYSFYFLDREWGPGFLKVCGYAPYPVKLCLNGHAWTKRQLTRRRLGFAPLDNGFQSGGSPSSWPTKPTTLPSRWETDVWSWGSGRRPGEVPWIGTSVTVTDPLGGEEAGLDVCR